MTPPRHNRSTPHRTFWAAILALAGSLLATEGALAACNAGERIGHAEAACLSVETRAATATEPHQYQIENTCSDYGSVAARIDLADGTHLTHTLTGEDYLRASTATAIQTVWCCSSDGDLCNISDLVSADSCVTEFEESPAAATCRNATATIDANNSCVLQAECVESVNADGTKLWAGSQGTFAWWDVDGLLNCSGWLAPRLTTCPAE